MFVVISRWTARSGEEEAVARSALAMIEPSRAEPGNVVYQPHRDPREPRVFVFYEGYVDEAAYDAHRESAHFRRHVVEGAIPRLDDREPTILETWEAEKGEPTRG